VWGDNPDIIEPACGDGAIVEVLQRMVCPQIFAGDIRYGQDFLKVESTGRYDFIITNPPYTYAQEFVDKSLKIANCVIRLLRLNFLASSKRKEWWGNIHQQRYMY
jgi:hypothetical protein